MPKHLRNILPMFSLSFLMGAGAGLRSKTLSNSLLIMVYIDNDAGNDGNTITVSDGNSLAGLDIYKDRLIVRQDNGGSLANADMGSAWISDAGDILYSVDGSNNLTVSGSSTELFIWSGDTFEPGANVSTAHVKIEGILTAGSNTLTVSGDWDMTNGTFNSGTSTVDFTGTGTISIDNAAWWSKYFYNLNAAAEGQTTTILAGRGIDVVNVMTLGTGTVDGGHVFLQKVSGTPLINAGAALSNQQFSYINATGPVTVAAATYPDLWIAGASAGTIEYELAGAINCDTLTIKSADSGVTSKLDTTASNHDITCSNLIVGDATQPDFYGTLKLNNSTLDINGDAVIYSSDAGGINSIDADTATINASGNWSNFDTFTADSSTMILNGSSTPYIASGGSAFNNLTATNSINSGNNDDGTGSPQWIFGGMPTITVTKLSLVISDPISGGTNPKRIPGAVIEYSIVPSNTGDGSPDADSTFVTDIIDTDSVQYDVDTGVSFTDGATSSGLALDTVSYSDDAAPGPYTYDYTPVPDGDGYDSNVTSLKVTTTGTFAFGGAPAPSFTLKYRSRIE